MSGWSRNITLPPVARRPQGSHHAPDTVLEENEGVGRRACDAYVGVRHHLVAAYLAKVNAMKRQFLRLAANGRN
jgi:hypothetical protein